MFNGSQWDFIYLVNTLIDMIHFIPCSDQTPALHGPKYCNSPTFTLSWEGYFERGLDYDLNGLCTIVIRILRNH